MTATAQAQPVQRIEQEALELEADDGRPAMRMFVWLVAYSVDRVVSKGSPEECAFMAEQAVKNFDRAFPEEAGEPA